MSWALVEQLVARFPDVEPLPHAAAAHAEPEVGSAPARPARHEPKGPVFHVPGAFVPAARLLEVCRVLRDEAPFRMDYCSFVSAVDRPTEQQMDVVYHLYSLEAGHELILKVRVPRDDPRVPSVTALWGGANWHERETYDLLGVRFEGHPDLRRIMMTEDWSGHPLRKDYTYQEPRWLVDLVTQRQREIEGLGLGDRA